MHLCVYIVKVQHDARMLRSANANVQTPLLPDSTESLSLPPSFERLICLYMLTSTPFRN